MESLSEMGASRWGAAERRQHWTRLDAAIIERPRSTRLDGCISSRDRNRDR